MDFNFNATAGTSQSTAKPKLPGNNIYDVTFEGCEIKDVTGVKDPSITYKQLILKFSNEDGSFEHTVWEPRPEDFTRRETESKSADGKINKIPQPSNVESMMLLFKHLIDVVNPKVAKEIDDKTRTLAAKTWDDLRKLTSDILNAGKGTKTKIKLMKNSKTGAATIPGFFAGLTKEGLAYVRNNFIGPKIAFSTYELQRITDENNAKPTKQDSFVLLPPEPESKDGLDITFEVDSSAL